MGLKEVDMTAVMVFFLAIECTEQYSTNWRKYGV